MVPLIIIIVVLVTTSTAHFRPYRSSTRLISGFCSRGGKHIVTNFEYKSKGATPYYNREGGKSTPWVPNLVKLMNSQSTRALAYVLFYACIGVDG